MDLANSLRRAAIALEQRWDSRHPHTPGPARFESYLGHGSAHGTVLRGRLLGGSAPSPAREGEAILSAVRRNLAGFATRERAHASLRVVLGAHQVEARTDAEGYLDLRLAPVTVGDDGDDDAGDDAGDDGWVDGRVELAAAGDAPHGSNGSGEVAAPLAWPVQVRVPSPAAAYAVISDLDDTVMVTGVRTPLTMLRHTFTGSALTRRTFPGTPALYRALAAGSEGPDTNPVFYVSSSPWNLHSFLTTFLAHHGFPRGPLLLRDLLGTGVRRRPTPGKLRHVVEVADLHPDLALVLIGDSGQEDAELYAEVVRLHPDRVLAVVIREVRPEADVGGERVDEIVTGWDSDVPVLLTRDTARMVAWLAELGLGGS